MRPRAILAVMDERGDDTALRTAMALASRYDATVLAVATVEPPRDLAVLSRVSGRSADDLMGELAEKKRAVVQDRLAQTIPGHSVTLKILTGKAFLEIVRFVVENEFDFVVKTAERISGLQRFLFASTDQHLLRKCPCPVWLQTEDKTVSPKRVLATVDLDISDAPEPETLMALNRRVVEAARLIADPSGEVVVLHVWDAPGEGMAFVFASSGDARGAAHRYVEEVRRERAGAMDAFLAETAAVRGPRLRPALVRGVPEQAIGAQMAALSADVVVMGTVARTGVSGVFIGNTAENVINSLDCPVLAVKPDGFRSPLAG